MKFSHYQQEVPLNVTNAPAVQAPTNIMSYGTAGKDWDGLTAGIGQLTKVVSQKQDESDAADVMDAKNKIMTSLTQQLYGENGLFETGVGENARGLADRTTKAIHDTYDEIAKGYNGRVQRALRSNINENMANFQRIAASKESQEREKTTEANYLSLLNNKADLAAQTYGVNGALTMQLDDTNRTVMAYGLTKGWSGQQMQMEIRSAKTKLVSSAVQAAMANDDIDQAMSILSSQRKDIDQMEYNRLMTPLKKKKDAQDIAGDAQSIFSQCYDSSTGTMDFDKLDQLLEKMAYRTVGGDVIAGSYSGDSTLDTEIITAAKDYNIDPDYVAAMAEIESGYQQGNPSKAGALGVMQLMPDTAAGLGFDPNNRAENIAGGAKYFAQMIAKFGGGEDDGTLRKAVMAYNAGPHAVETGAAEGYSESVNHWVKFEKALKEIRARKKTQANNNIDTTPNYAYESGVNLTIADNFNKKLSAFDNWFAKQPEANGTHLDVTSANDGSHDDSRHYSGEAADVVSDALKDDDFRSKCLAKAAELGLGYYDEYDRSNWTGKTTGDNLHLTDNGETFTGGSGSHQVYDFERKEKMREQVMALYREKETIRKQQHASQLENIGKVLQSAGSYSRALTILEGQTGLSMQEYNSLKSTTATFYGVNKSTGAPTGRSRSSTTRYTGTSGETYTASEVRNAREWFSEYQDRMGDPEDTISRTDQRKYNRAARIINDIEGNSGDNVASEEALEMAHHAINVTENDEAAEWYLITNYNYSESEAKAYVQMAHGDE